MLPIRFASLALARRLFGLTLLLVLMAIGLGPMRAGPLAAVGVDDFRALIEPKHDPSPDPSEAGPVLSDYRRKIRKIAKELPSLGEVSRVLLLSEWTAPEIEPESPVALDQIKKVVQEPTDQAFQLGVQQLMAKSEDSIGISRAIVAEIKRDVRLKLIERLQKRISFYLLEGRTEDRIAAANLIRDTMSNSRRQDISTYRDPTSGAVVAGVMANKREDIRPSAQYLRQRMRELSGDLKKLTEHPNIQARAAGLMALSDLEDDPTFLVNIYKPLLTSPESDVRVRRATAEALSHTLEVAGVQMEKDRPEPYLRGLKVLLPVAVLGLTDSDTRVRRASLEACERAAVIFDELAGDPLSATDRRVVFRSALDVMDQILPKLNAAARDSVPEYRVAACKVLETLVLGMQKLQRFKNEPLPPPGIDPTVPPAPPSSDKERSKKKVSLPIQRSGRGRVSAGPSQWAAARLNPASGVALAPREATRGANATPLASESAAPSVTLERPIKLTASAVRQPASVGRIRNPSCFQMAAFLAPQLDDQLPPPALVESGIQGTVQILVENLKDRDYRVRLAAADTLETLGEIAAPAVPGLVAALRDSNKFVRWCSARTLGKLNPRQPNEVVPGLMRLLNDREDPSVRIAAAKALELYGEHAKAAVPLLARVINRGDKTYIIAILHTIQGIGTDAAPALPNVAWILSDRSQPPSVRIEAAQTLGRFGSLATEQLPVLLDIMNNDSDEDVRNAASIAVLAVDRPMK